MHDYHDLLGGMLLQVLGAEPKISQVNMQSGGCINQAVDVQTDQGHFFVKWNERSYADMFEKEALGLELLSATETIRIPKVIGHGQVEGKAFLVLEYLERGLQSQLYWEKLGEGMAALHSCHGNVFGLGHNNYIGKLAQNNGEEANWVKFFIERRLSSQLGLAIDNDYVNAAFIADFKSFLVKVPEIMPQSQPSLLHGDLWNGNVMPVVANEASIFDPAVYYGAREMDLAMTRLFGGFDQRFYDAYHSVYPIPQAFDDLIDVYNLYPLMVHVNLFGPNSGYLHTVTRIIKRYL